MFKHNTVSTWTFCSDLILSVVPRDYLCRGLHVNGFLFAKAYPGASDRCCSDNAHSLLNDPCPSPGIAWHYTYTVALRHFPYQADFLGVFPCSGLLKSQLSLRYFLDGHKTQSAPIACCRGM